MRHLEPTTFPRSGRSQRWPSVGRSPRATYLRDASLPALRLRPSTPSVGAGYPGQILGRSMASSAVGDSDIVVRCFLRVSSQPVQDELKLSELTS